MAATSQESRLSDGRDCGNDRLLQIIGAGPAGIGMVIALCNQIAAGEGDVATQQRLLDSLGIYESEPVVGGKMGRYRINANTSARDTVRGIRDGNPFVAVRDHYLADPATSSDLIALPEIGRLMIEPLAVELARYLGDRLQCGSRVERIEVCDGGFHSYAGDNRLLSRSRYLLLCCGAREIPLPELLPFRDRWEGSGQFLLRGHLDGLRGDNSLIVIVGASHSAFSCAWRLLHDPLFRAFGRDREILILHRRERIKLRCTPEFAAEHGVDYDPEVDVCPDSGLVFRNGGLRKDAKLLYLQIRNGIEKRVGLVEMNNLSEQQELLETAGLIIQATGFSSNLPLVERAGQVLSVGQPTADGALRDLDSGETLPGLFGMGLGLNILPESALSEPGFKGGIHGFQSYPLTIAPRIIEQITADMKRGAVD